MLSFRVSILNVAMELVLTSTCASHTGERCAAEKDREAGEGAGVVQSGERLSFVIDLTLARGKAIDERDISVNEAERLRLDKTTTVEEKKRAISEETKAAIRDIEISAAKRAAQAKKLNEEMLEKRNKQLTEAERLEKE
eukprot:1179942-Prorocentrum_minimum.AAC.3